MTDPSVYYSYILFLNGTDSQEKDCIVMLFFRMKIN